jgi:cytochrome c2
MEIMITNRLARLRSLVMAAIVGVAMFAARTAAAEAQPAEGQRIFSTVCNACHTIGQGVKVGPDLKGVTSRRDPAWIKRQILDPAALRASGDPISKENVTASKGVQMPNLGLKESDADNLIAFLGQGESAPPPQTPPAYLPTLGIGVLLLVALTAASLIAGSKKDVEVKA